MTERMNPPALGVTRLAARQKLMSDLGRQLQSTEDGSATWNESVWSYAIEFFELFYEHYSSFPDFADEAAEAARTNAVASTSEVIRKQIYNYNSLGSIYEKRIFEAVSDHIRRVVDKPKLRGITMPLYQSPVVKALLNAIPPIPLAMPSAPSSTRRNFVQPLLDTKGWSLLDWATEANLAPHTVTDYMAGKTIPYPSTRKKLAHALGVSIQQLPK